MSDTSSATSSNGAQATDADLDAIVVGAGFAGLYMLHRLRGLGLRTKVIETADGVGGTWYWNRYPGARCDIVSIDYSYSFDAELEEEWQWTEKYATQPEILAYLNHVADKFDLRSDIQFSTKVAEAAWDDDAQLWRVTTDDGTTTTCRHYIMATGCLSAPKDIDIEGADRFQGEVYFTSRWPHDGVDLTGKRVAVIGTGSSGIQSIPIMAQQADAMTVFQRTPNYSMPARNGPIPEYRQQALDEDREAYREAARWSQIGVPIERTTDSVLGVSEEERNRRFERIWEMGELAAPGEAFADMLFNEESNELISEFVRDKIREVVDDPETAEILCPKDYPFFTKRPCLDSGYFETFNLPHVELVDLRSTPITTITETGIDTADTSRTFDVIVYATGFDAMTGAIVAVDIKGRNGLPLAEKWAEGPRTYLGLMVVGFPNFFAITGPGSPSVLSNMAVSIEQHVDVIADTIEHLDANGYRVIEPTQEAEEAWVTHVADAGNMTLFPETDSWYMGANVPGKPRVFLPFVGGVDYYRLVCDEVMEDGSYVGFELSGPAGTQRNTEIIRSLMPDVQLVLQALAEAGVPPIESMSPPDARAFLEQFNAEAPPGPEVGEVVDGTFPGADGDDLEYRLYRPATDGPHPMIAYFHGGGWVLGDHASDDPFCRDLCDRTGAIVVSCNYRHAPEHKAPAAAEDGYAAVQWIADNAEALGGIPGQLVVAGWSAGANVAAVAAQTARDRGGPTITGQMLVTPVTDADFSRPSYTDNAEGYFLTRSLMEWFWDHYCDAADRADPKVSPLQADDLSNLPPAFIATSEFDPLRDEGRAYADALEAAGVDVGGQTYRGQIHTSLTAVNMVITGADARADMAEAIRGFFAATVPAS